MHEHTQGVFDDMWMVGGEEEEAEEEEEGGAEARTAETADKVFLEREEPTLPGSDELPGGGQPSGVHA